MHTYGVCKRKHKLLNAYKFLSISLTHSSYAYAFKAQPLCSPATLRTLILTFNFFTSQYLLRIQFFIIAAMTSS